MSVVASRIVPAVSRRRGRTLLIAWDDVLLAPAGALTAVGPAFLVQLAGGLATSFALRAHADGGAATRWPRQAWATGRDAIAAGVQVAVVAGLVDTVPPGSVGLVVAVCLGLVARWLVEQGLLVARSRAAWHGPGLMRWFVVEPVAAFAPAGLAIGALVALASADVWTTVLAAVLAVVLLGRMAAVERQRDHNELAAGVVGLTKRIPEDASRDDMVSELVAVATELWPYHAVAIEVEAPGAAVGGHSIVDPDGCPLWLVLRRPDDRTPDVHDTVLLDALTQTVNGALARRRLVESMRDAQTIRTAVLAAVAHDIRGPLLVLTGGATTLRVQSARLSDDQRVRVLGQMEHAGQRMTRLVEDLLDLERLSFVGGQALTEGSCEPRGVIDRVVEDLELTDQADVRHDLSTRHIAMPEQLFARVVENLVGNAIKHSPPDAPIVIWCRNDRDEIRIRIDDHGPGVPAEAHTAIFAAFEQLDDEKATQGVGLGLYVVGRFVRACNGDVWVTDSPSGGASFCLSLPTAPPGPTAATDHG